jgi:hypothetical protein
MSCRLYRKFKICLLKTCLEEFFVYLLGPSLLERVGLTAVIMIAKFVIDTGTTITKIRDKSASSRLVKEIKTKITPPV